MEVAKTMVGAKSGTVVAEDGKETEAVARAASMVQEAQVKMGEMG